MVVSDDAILGQTVILPLVWVIDESNIDICGSKMILNIQMI